MVADDKTIIRVQKNKENPYVMINKDIYLNPNLTWKAKGILSYLLSCPDDWRLYVGDLVKRSTDGRTAVYSALKELMSFGYVERNRIYEKGKIVRWEYIVYESPLLSENLKIGSQEVEKQDVENETQLINNLTDTDVTNKQQQYAVVNSAYAKITGKQADLSPLVDKHGYERVMQAIRYMQRYRKKIDNPYGFLCDCLNLNWDFTIPTDQNLKRLQDTSAYIDTLTNTPRPEPEQFRDIIHRLMKQLE